MDGRKLRNTWKLEIRVNVRRGNEMQVEWQKEWQNGEL